MKRSRFSEEQIIGILKEHQAGMTAVDLCRFDPRPCERGDRMIANMLSLLGKEE